MSFKQEYLSWIKRELEDLTPNGYSIKVLEDFGSGSIGDDKFEIKCYIKFGSASKQNNTRDRINQPLIFSIFSEGDNHRVAEEIFSLFFLTFSKTHTSLSVDEKANDLWHYYTAPSIQTAFNQVGLYQRANLIMTGVVSYSTEKIIGVRWFLDNVEIQAVTPQSLYQTEVKSINYDGENTGKANILGSSNTYSFIMLLEKNGVSKALRDTAILGTPYFGRLTVEYSDKSYSLDVIATNVIIANDSDTGDNILTITLMPV